MLRLYHSPMTRSSRIVWLLEELGADAEIVYVDVSRPDGSSGPDPRNPHPDKKVPVIEHDGVLVTESAAICAYLTDLFPDAGVGPTVGDPARGPYLSWLAYYAGVVEPVLHFRAAGLEDNAFLQRTFRGVAEMHARLLDTLSRGPYLLGDSFSAVDILFQSMALVDREWLPAGDLVDGYLTRLAARPAFARALAKDAAA